MCEALHLAREEYASKARPRVCIFPLMVRNHKAFNQFARVRQEGVQNGAVPRLKLIRMEYSIKELIRIELAIECACCAIVLSRSWKAWPVGCGKAHDATLVARWLEKALEGIVVVSW